MSRATARRLSYIHTFILTFLHSYIHTFLHSCVHTFILLKFTNTQCMHKHSDTRVTARTVLCLLKHVWCAPCSTVLLPLVPRRFLPPYALGNRRVLAARCVLLLRVSWCPPLHLQEALVTAELDERDKRAFGLERRLVEIFGVDEENGVTGVLGVVTAVDGLTFLADGDGVFGIRLSLPPPFRLHRPCSCVFAQGAEMKHLFQISHVPSPPLPVEAQFAMDSEISWRVLALIPCHS